MVLLSKVEGAFGELTGRTNEVEPGSLGTLFAKQRSLKFKIKDISSGSAMVRFPGCRRRTGEGVGPKGRNGSETVFAVTQAGADGDLQRGSCSGQREAGRFERRYGSRRDRRWWLISSKGEGQAGSKGGARTSDWVMDTGPHHGGQVQDEEQFLEGM